MTSSAKAEPQGSEPSSTECRLFKGNGWHCLTHSGPNHTDGACCECGVTREELAKESAPEAEPQCPSACAEGHTYSGSCTQRAYGPGEPPLTPEEEEEAPEDPKWSCMHTNGCRRILDGVCLHGCRDAADELVQGMEPSEDDKCVFCWHTEAQHDLLAQTCTVNGEPSRCGCERFRTASEYTPCVNCGHIEPEHAPGARDCSVCSCDGYQTEPDFELPPQPERRAPYVATYSVGGHLYEVALPGDACLQAVDGALVIRHGLGPVAGLVAFQPMTIEPQKEGQ